MTPRAIEDLLAASVARRMAGRTLLDEDYGTVLSVDATNHIARVTISDVELWVPFGKGAPAVGRVYPVRRTLEGARWLVVGGVAACRTWTFNSDFNEEGATFAGEMTAFGDALRLPTFLTYGDGRDGPGVAPADVNLNLDSICGRTDPDACFGRVGVLDSFSLTFGTGDGYFSNMGNLIAGDQVLIYVAQGEALLSGHTFGDVDDMEDVGRWEIHEVTGGGPGGVAWEDYPCGLPFEPVKYVIYCQRIPQYTTVTGGPITCGRYQMPIDAIEGTGLVCVKATGISTASYRATAKGYGGGLDGTEEMCFPLPLPDPCGQGDWSGGWPGHGLRAHNRAILGVDHYQGNCGMTGGGGGGTQGNTNACLSGDYHGTHGTPGHEHDGGDLGASAAGGAHATRGTTLGAPSHARAGMGMHPTIRPSGNQAEIIGQGLQGWDDTAGAITTTVAMPLVDALPIHGRACFGGGGGSGANYWFNNNPPGMGFPGSFFAGAGGNGGGFVAVFARDFRAWAGNSAVNPTVDANGGGAADRLSGGGAGGSALIWCETIGAGGGGVPIIHVEETTTGNVNLGRSGAGGGSVGNAFDVIPAGGDGGLGRMHVHYETTKVGYAGNGSMYETSGGATSAGCWTSAPLSGTFLGLEAGEPLTGTTFAASWTPDSDDVPPVFTVEASADAGFGSPTTYTFTPGGAVDIDSGVPVDLSALPVAAAPYWRVGVCLDSGADLTDTPTVEDLELCLEGG